MLVIFDWDGTLVDSAGKISACLAAASGDCGLPLLTIAQYKHIIGLGLPQAISALYPDENEAVREKLRLAYIERFMADASPSQLFEDVSDGLKSLRKQGYRLAVATGKSRRGMNRILDELDMHHTFDITRCADETRSKPDPLMLAEILAHTGLGANEAIMVGDTSFDLEMAANASMRSIAVAYGAHSPESLLAYQPISVASNFSDVLALISKALPLLR